VTATYDAVVLAGGRSRRMAVEDKTRLVVGGVALLDRVLTACAGAQARIVVGDERPVGVPVVWTRETPAGGGPVAALRAGLALVTAPVVVLLAGDLPFLDAATVGSLVSAVEGSADDGAVLVDSDGREQWLCGAWRVQARRGDELPDAGSVRSTLGGLRFARLPAGGSAAAPWLDCDTPDDVHRAEELLP
jgi:molybdopterin-guanine dinucleotide biosynthesis protein A